MLIGQVTSLVASPEPFVLKVRKKMCPEPGRVDANRWLLQEGLTGEVTVDSYTL